MNTPARSKQLGFLPDVDYRLPIARRYRELVCQIVADQGGVDHCSEARMQLIRRFASVSVLAETLEAHLASGEDVDIAEHALLCSTLTRLCQRIGIDRRVRNVTPVLSDYLEYRSNGKSETDAADADD